MDLVSALQQSHEKNKLPDFKAGDTVRVHIKVVEAQKERIQVFEGTVIKTRGSSTGKTFTVRKISGGLGVERIFPYHSPSITKLEVVRKGKVRRSKLYYLRQRKGRAAQVKQAKS
jgi:large subunit ribosomal protein L19